MTRYCVHRGVLQALMDAQGYRDAATLAREAGISPSIVQKIVTGARTTTSLDTLDALADVLEVRVAALGRPLSEMWVMGSHGPEPLARRVSREGAAK